jgi:hypothetical protein
MAWDGDIGRRPRVFFLSTIELASCHMKIEE